MSKPTYRVAMALVSSLIACILVGGCGGGGGGSALFGPLALVTGTAYHEVAGGVCCNPPTDTPLASTAIVFHTTSGVPYSLRVQTNATGHYSASLPQGVYAVDIADLSTGPSYNTVTPQQITVTPPSNQLVDVKFIQDVP